MLIYPLSEKNEKEVLEALQSSASRMEWSANLKQMALLYAVEKGSFSLADDLMSIGASPNVPYYRSNGLLGGTAFSLATENLKDKVSIENAMTAMAIIRQVSQSKSPREKNPENIETIKENINESIENHKNDKVASSQLKTISEMIQTINMELDDVPGMKEKLYSPDIDPDMLEKLRLKKNATDKEIKEKVKEFEKEQEEKAIKDAEFEVQDSESENYYKFKISDFSIASLDGNSSYKHLHGAGLSVKNKPLPEPNWINKDDDRGKELWASLQLTERKTQNFISGKQTTALAYLGLGVMPMAAPFIFVGLNAAMGATAMAVMPALVLTAPVLGAAFLFSKAPRMVSSIIDNVRLLCVQREVNLLVKRGIDAGIIDGDEFKDKLQLNEDTLSKKAKKMLLVHQGKEYRIENLVYNAILKYNKTAENKIDVTVDKKKNKNKKNGIIVKTKEQVCDKIDERNEQRKNEAGGIVEVEKKRKFGIM